MADRHLIMHVIQHDDGSHSTRQWTPLDGGFAEEYLLRLGSPSRETYLPAAVSSAFGPMVRGASVVVEHDGRPPPDSSAG